VAIVLILPLSPGWILDARKFKTFGRYGPQPTPLHSKLVTPVELFVETERPHLLNGGVDHGFFFVNDAGLPYATPSSWTKAMQAIFKDVVCSFFWLKFRCVLTHFLPSRPAFP